MHLRAPYNSFNTEDMKLYFKHHSKVRLYQRVNGVRISEIIDAFNAGEYRMVQRDLGRRDIYFNDLNVKVRAVLEMHCGETQYVIPTLGHIKGIKSINPKKIARASSKLRKERQRHADQRISRRRKFGYRKGRNLGNLK